MLSRVFPRLLALALAFTLGTVAAPAAASVDSSQHFAAVKTATPPPLDASLPAAAWRKALVATGFFDFTTREPAKYATTAYLLYDDVNLYVGFHCVQTGTPITAAQTVNNAGVGSDDHVAISLDTSGNGSRVYSFKVTPKGIHDEYSSEDSRYAPPWKSVGKIFPNGDYNVMMVIPLADLRAQGSAVAHWRVNFVRSIAATNEEYTWAYDPTMNDVGASQFWPWLDGLQLAAHATQPQPRADVYALASAGSDRRQFQNGIGNFEQMNPRAIGLDATYPFTNTLALVGTLNPDFSNIEQDQTTIAPQEFQRNYQEYRPFFSEGSHFINALPGININGYETLFYTPSIGIFNRGLKLEGTTGNNSIGALNVSGSGFDDTALGYNYTPPNNAFGVSFEDVLANHTGLRDNTEGFALDQRNVHSGELSIVRFEQETGTNVTAPGAAQSLEFGAGLQSARQSAFLVYKDLGPAFAPVDGYTQSNDIAGPQLFWQYNGVGPHRGGVQSYQVFLVGDRYSDRSGAVHQADVDANVDVTLRSLLSFNYGTGTSELRLYGTPYPVYANPQQLTYNQQSLGVGYKDGTPNHVDASYSWGPFGGSYLQQIDASTTRQFGAYGISLEFAGSIEHASAGALPRSNSQWLRSASLSRSFGRDALLAIGIRSINGTGGFAVPATNLAISYHQRLRNQDELYIDYGTPAAYQTLHRLLVKIVFHVGGGTGT